MLSTGEALLLYTCLNILLIINNRKLLIINHTYLFNSVAKSVKEIFIGQYYSVQGL